ncbi:hypothetical protein QDY32_004501 [Salmonella enterica]|nr:hypothetical protein [Salmonella enterica]EJF6002698.1 hypothetical protein [Salmonella enterica]EJF6030260.1 hypothetical protein [Salmonella enterica]EJF6191740.1 hypothetical protein [Salmonella enterica]EJW2075748.1 hypothetical protein [Salmonella enterica]
MEMVSNGIKNKIKKIGFTSKELISVRVNKNRMCSSKKQITQTTGFDLCHCKKIIVSFFIFYFVYVVFSDTIFSLRNK